MVLLQIILLLHIFRMEKCHHYFHYLLFLNRKRVLRKLQLYWAFLCPLQLPFQHIYPCELWSVWTGYQWRSLTIDMEVLAGYLSWNKEKRTLLLQTVLYLVRYCAWSCSLYLLCAEDKCCLWCRRKFRWTSARQSWIQDNQWSSSCSYHHNDQLYRYKKSILLLWTVCLSCRHNHPNGQLLYRLKLPCNHG